MFAFSYKLTLFSMLVIPVSAFFIARIVKTLRSQAARAQQVYGVMISYLDEALSGIKIIKAFNATRSEEHTSELQSLMRNSYAVFCLKKTKKRNHKYQTIKR